MSTPSPLGGGPLGRIVGRESLFGMPASADATSSSPVSTRTFRYGVPRQRFRAATDRVSNRTVLIMLVLYHLIAVAVIFFMEASGKGRLEVHTNNTAAISTYSITGELIIGGEHDYKQMSLLQKLAEWNSTARSGMT